MFFLFVFCVFAALANFAAGDVLAGLVCWALAGGAVAASIAADRRGRR